MRFEEANDPLDELLAKARWPIVSDESTRRLRDRWMELKRTARQMFWARLSVAAGVILIIGFGMRFARLRESERLVLHDVPRFKLEEESVSRPATVLETEWLRLSMSAAKGTMADRSKSGKELPVAASGEPRPGDGRSQNPQGPGSGERIAAAPRDSTESLFSSLNDPHISVREGAEMALARIDGPLVTSRLIAMSESGINPREAMAALVRIHSQQARQYVRKAISTPGLSAIARSALAQSGDGTNQSGGI